MLESKLGFYAARNEVVNENKSVVMYFGSDVQVPVLKYRGSELAAVDSFKYLGMSFTRAVSMTAAAEQVVPAIQGGCLRVRKFVSEHGLAGGHAAQAFVAGQSICYSS